MNLDKIYSDEYFEASVVPDGTRLVFLGYENGVSGTVTFRYKDSAGAFGNVIIVPEAETYTLPVATASVLGGIKVGANLTITADGILNATDTNTTYSVATTLTDGLLSASDKSKLDSLVNYEKNKGFYQTSSALTSAHPTANAGDYAVVGETDTVWVWDVDSSAWVNSSKTSTEATAENVSIADAGGYFTSTTAEGALQELAAMVTSANEILDEV